MEIRLLSSLVVIGAFMLMSQPQWLTILKILRLRSRGKSITTRKTGGLILTLKGSVVFTAEPQRTLREIFF